MKTVSIKDLGMPFRIRIPVTDLGVAEGERLRLVGLPKSEPALTAQRGMFVVVRENDPRPPLRGGITRKPIEITLDVVNVDRWTDPAPTTYGSKSVREMTMREYVSIEILKALITKHGCDPTGIPLTKNQKLGDWLADQASQMTDLHIKKLSSPS